MQQALGAAENTFKQTQCLMTEDSVLIHVTDELVMNKYLVKDVFPNSLTIHFVFTDETGCSCK